MRQNATTESEWQGAIVRDHLAGDRTVLANERTFLAYVRTALTFFVAGLTFIKFFDQTAVQIIGYIFIPVALVILAIGMVSFKRNRTHINKVACGDPEE